MDAFHGYREWLRRRGLGDSTIHQYVFHAGRAVGGEDPFDRITDRGLSPKYRRVCKAAIISFARYNESLGDKEATKTIASIKEVKLPSPVRQEVKVPLTMEQWRALRAEIDEADYISEPMRCELGLMASRGLRRGDVLRLHRKEISEALKTGTLSYVAKGERRLEFGVLSWVGYLETLHREFSAAKGSEVVADLISPGSAEKTRMKVAGALVVKGLRKVAAKVEGIDEIAPHDLRRTYATHYYEACGKDPAKLQAHMCWSSLTTAMGYVNAGSRESLDAVAEEMLK